MSLGDYRGYSSYRSSGLVEIGEIPAHWDVKPLKRLTSFTTGWTPPSGRDDLYDGEHLWATIADLGPRVLNQTGTTISDRAVAEARMQLVPRGSLLFSFKLSVGMVSIAGSPMYTNEAIAAFRPSPLIDADYLYWAAPLLLPRNAQDNIYNAPLLSRERMSNAAFIVPPAIEQRTIAAFLDRETARIDALVEKKEQLIQRLIERRGATITRAVTEGIDDHKDVKDSGSTFFGTIPTHWSVRRIRHLVNRIEQGWSPECENREASETEWGVLKAGCVNRGQFVEGEHKALPRGLTPPPELEIRENDLLMSRASGSRELVGSVALVPQCRQRLLLCDKLFRLHTSGHRPFLAYALNSRPARAQIESVLSGGSGLANNIAQDVVKDLLVAVPPDSEQRRIAAFLDHDARRTQEVIDRVHAAVQSLAELRNAVITSAITGAIDVRGVA